MLIQLILLKFNNEALSVDVLQHCLFHICMDSALMRDNQVLFVV